jgi:hypothetical protein
VASNGLFLFLLINILNDYPQSDQWVGITDWNNSVLQGGAE